MGNNGVSNNKPQVELNAAQKAQVQRAIEAYNQKAGENAKIDADDVFSIAKNKKGQITIRVDAYGLEKGSLNTKVDGQFDLTLTLDDSQFYDAGKDVQFVELEDSTANLQKYVKKQAELEALLKQDYIEFSSSDNDKRLKNMEDINKRFMATDTNIVPIAYYDQPAYKPDVSLDKFDTAISNLEKKLAEMKENKNFSSDAAFLTSKEKEDLAVSTNGKKEMKKIRKDIIDSLETAIKDLKDMKKDLEARQKDARGDLSKLNKKMEELGFTAADRQKLRKEQSTTDLNLRDYKENNLNKDLAGTYATPQADKLKNVPFDSNNLPAQFSTPTTQNMVKATVEATIAAYNKDHPDAPVSMDKIAQITINPKTGDILIGLSDSKVAEGETSEHDGHYDLKIAGFYNPKSQMINLGGKFELGDYGASTYNIDQLKHSYQDTLRMSDSEFKTSQLRTISDQLRVMGVSTDELEALKESVKKK